MPTQRTPNSLKAAFERHVRQCDEQLERELISVVRDLRRTLAVERHDRTLAAQAHAHRTEASTRQESVARRHREAVAASRAAAEDTDRLHELSDLGGEVQDANAGEGTPPHTGTSPAGALTPSDGEEIVDGEDVFNDQGGASPALGAGRGPVDMTSPQVIRAIKQRLPPGRRLLCVDVRNASRAVETLTMQHMARRAEAKSHRGPRFRDLMLRPGPTDVPPAGTALEPIDGASIHTGDGTTGTGGGARAVDATDVLLQPSIITMPETMACRTLPLAPRTTTPPRGAPISEALLRSHPLAHTYFAGGIGTHMGRLPPLEDRGRRTGGAPTDADPDVEGTTPTPAIPLHRRLHQRAVPRPRKVLRGVLTRPLPMYGQAEGSPPRRASPARRQERGPSTATVATTSTSHNTSVPADAEGLLTLPARAPPLQLHVGASLIAVSSPSREGAGCPRGAEAALAWMQRHAHPATSSRSVLEAQTSAAYAHFHLAQRGAAAWLQSHPPPPPDPHKAAARIQRWFGAIRRRLGCLQRLCAHRTAREAAAVQDEAACTIARFFRHVLLWKSMVAQRALVEDATTAAIEDALLWTHLQTETG